MSDREPGLAGWLWTGFVYAVGVGLAILTYVQGYIWISLSVVAVGLFWIVLFATMPDPPDDYDHHDHHHHH